MVLEYYKYPDAPSLYKLGIVFWLLVSFIIFGWIVDWDTISLSIPTLYFSFSLVGIIYYSMYPYRVRFYKEKAIYETFLGVQKTIYNKEIVFTEEYVSTKDKSQDILLIIYFRHYRFKILHSKDKVQYENILNFCKEYYRKGGSIKLHRYLYPLLAVISILFFEVMLVDLVCDGITDNSKKVNITGTYENHIINRAGSKVRKPSSVEIVLKEYPDLEFGPMKYDTEKIREKFQNRVFVKGKKLTFTISKNDFEKKIQKSEEMCFCDRYFNRTLVKTKEEIDDLD